MRSTFAKMRPVKGSLTARALDAAGWNLIDSGAAFFLRLASNLIMTRLLMPEAFGILAFAMTFATAVALLTDIGIRQSIVREQDMMGPRFLRTAWSVRIVRSCTIAAGVLVAAIVFEIFKGSIGRPESVMAQPELPLLIALTAFAPLAEGLKSTNWDAAIRRMQYKRVVTLEISSTIIRIILQISFALISPTVWALLIGTLAGGFARAILSHLYLSGPKMRPVWDRVITKRLWDYGKWIMGSSMMSFVINNTDKIVFGALVSSVSMGLYVIAFIWIGAAQRVLDIFARSLGFSITSEILRERPDEMKRVMRKFQVLVDAGSLISFFTLALGGPLLVWLLYTPIYAPAGALIQLLSPLLLVARFNQLTNVVLAAGDSNTMFRMSVSVALATVAFTLLGLHYGGFEGAVTGMVLARFVSVPYLLTKTAPIFGPRQTMFDALFGVGAVVATLVCYVLV